MVDKIVASLSGDDRSFYEREFAFFNRVTSISGILKPFIKRPKSEKKVQRALDTMQEPLATCMCLSAGQDR